jgi:hypothetical protein
MPERIMAGMTYCEKHDLEFCGGCDEPTTPHRASGTGTGSGKRFALIHAPGLRDDTYLHLNREGETWAIRMYSSPSSPAVELGRSSRPGVDLAALELADEITYPYSTSPGGVSVEDSRYWFDEIARRNATLAR